MLPLIKKKRGLSVILIENIITFITRSHYAKSHFILLRKNIPENIQQLQPQECKKKKKKGEKYPDEKYYFKYCEFRLLFPCLLQFSLHGKIIKSVAICSKKLPSLSTRSDWNTGAFKMCCCTILPTSRESFHFLIMFAKTSHFLPVLIKTEDKFVLS